MKIYLASRSPRRQALLQQIGIEYEVIDVGIDESWDKKELPKDHVKRLALEKARAGLGRIKPGGPVLGADTAVVLDDLILGKAMTKDEAIYMLQKLSGRTHEVFSAVAIIHSKEHCLLNISKVSFRPLSKTEIESYCNSGEPVGKAGGYAIQGQAAAFISYLEGSYSGVMGLPLYETRLLLEQAGVTSV